MLIGRFTQQGAFGPEATVAMGQAFDAACEELRCTIRKVALAKFTIFPARGLPAIYWTWWSPSIGTTGRRLSEQVVAVTWCAHYQRCNIQSRTPQAGLATP